MTTPALCPRCGAPLKEGACGSCNDERAFRVVRREIAILVLLSVAAVPTYLFTRAMADRNRRTETRIGAEWFRRGQEQLRAGDTSAAADSLRRASVRDRENPKIALALAQVLAARHRDGEARTALVRLLESFPDDREIHLELARLSARGGDVSSALLHFHLALYGTSRGLDAEAGRRAIRMELVRFLLDHGERGRALSELLVLAAETPANPEAYVEIAGLFLEAGDPARALEQYVKASQLDKRSGPALAGAGEASFLLGNYAPARRYLERAVEQDPKDARASSLLSTARLIQSANPLAPRVPFAERMKRLLAGLDQAAIRLESCLRSQLGRAAPRADLEQLRAEVEPMRRALGAKGRHPDPDLVQSGSDLVFRIEEATARACGEPAGLDLALLLIGRKHGGAGS